MTSESKDVVRLPECEDPELALAVDDLDFETVDVPEWGMRIRVRGMTGAERDEWEGAMADTRRPGQMNPNWSVNQRARMVARCCIKADGERLFSSAHIERLSRKNAKALDRLYDVARRLSGIGDVEQAMGNLSGGLSAENGSGSPTALAAAP